ncbi:Alpha/beta hydrolase family protein [Rhodococcus erythropolis]|uniref:PGAP1-like alpha/beta domain-containing protein n=1 Tax=Rhodococcus erythropolis TaxID=1833 RepID=UPI000BB2EB89|nr:hypothetical protein [Rhodococcus erythropolis]PBJ01611.1 Alpha/beta hydrolase family protein [Rhodococcus erythropolis]
MSVVAEVSAIDFAETEFERARGSALIREVGPLVPGPPSLAMCLSEPTRGLVDIASLLVAAPWLLRSPRGDGHPVLVLPGLLTSDVSTFVLRAYLGFLGYRVHGWNLGINTGPTAMVVDGLPAALAAVSDRYQQKVSVIGWSLGGIYARKLARDLPDSVRQVVTLGSPFGLTSLEQTRVGSLYARLSGNHAMMPPVDGIESEQGPPISVPATSVYSRHDGIVPWQACCETTSGLSESVAVQGSHMGLTHNPSALWTVADRLAQDVDNWQPFAAPKRLRRMFPAEV